LRLAGLIDRIPKAPFAKAEQLTNEANRIASAVLRWNPLSNA
jgi:hypothetical protein